MRRFAISLTVMTGISAGALACGEKLPLAAPPQSLRDSTVRSVVVSPQTASVKIGEQLHLAASIAAGLGVTLRTVSWSSSNPMIASVSDAGLVTPGTRAGLVTITATSRADTTIKGMATITVSAASSP